MRKIFAEVLKDVSDAPEFEDKVMVLQSNNSLMLRQLLAAAVNPSVKFDVKVPSYRINQEENGYASNTLFVEVKRLYVFLDTYKAVSPTRKAALLGQILEAIDRDDAVALIDVINKDLAKYGITKQLVDAAFPGLIK
jgi:hypothetical protein